MRSGTSYFNRTLFAKHFARFWPVWGLYGLIWAVCLPLNILLQSRDGWTLVRARLLPLNYLDGGGGPSAAVFLAAVFGLLAAMGVFSYLYSARSAGLFHALPLRREGLFLTSWLAGLGFLLLPNLAVFLLSLLLEAAGGAVAFSSLFTWLVTSSLLGLFFYSFAVFCAMFTGHILALPAFYVILNGLAGGLVFLFDAVAGQFLFGFDGLPWLEEAALWLSPALRLAVSCRVVYPSVPAEDGVAALNEEAAYFAGLGPVALYALVGLVLAGLALAVYRRRQVETAGDVVSVAWVRPVFKYGVAFCAAAALGVFFYTLFADLLPRGTWGLLAVMLLWGAVGYFVAEMLLRKKFRVFRDSWRGCAALLACLCLGMCLMEFDALGYESRVPDPAQVQSVSLHTGSTAPYDDYNSLARPDARTPEEIGAVTALHRSITARKGELENAEMAYTYTQTADGLEVEASAWTQVRLRYTLKNGAVLSRNYDIPITQAALDDPDTPAARLDAILNDPASVEAAYLSALETGDPLISAEVTVYDREEDYYLTEPVDSGAIQGLLDAVKADLADGSLGRRYLLENEARMDNCCINDLLFTFRGAGSRGVYSVSVTLQTTARRTLDALEEAGFDTGLLLTQAQSWAEG